MVIVCPQCSTKFRVNSERIPDGGAKVRCARCKHVFLTQKQAEDVIPTLPVDPSEAEKTDTVAPADPVPEPEPTEESDAHFGTEPEAEQDLQSEPVPIGNEELETDTDQFPEDDQEPLGNDSLADEDEQENRFSYDQFRELDPKPENDGEDFSFDSEPEVAEGAEKPIETEQEEENFSFSGPAEEAEKPSGALLDEEPATAGKKKKYSDDELTALFADDPAGEETAAEKEPPAPTPTAKKSNPLVSLIRILLLLILGLAIIGGALYFLNGPEQIEQAIQQLLGQQVESVEQGRITLSGLEGKFINNQEAGELFVIRGAATNNYREPRASIQVKGIIFDQNGQQLLQKTIFCGNPITDQELQTLPFSQLEEMMRNQFGKAMSNVKVNNKESIPFVIAFRDLPQNLSEFSVDIVSSEPVVQ